MLTQATAATLLESFLPSLFTYFCDFFFSAGGADSAQHWLDVGGWSRGDALVACGRGQPAGRQSDQLQLSSCRHVDPLHRCCGVQGSCPDTLSACHRSCLAHCVHPTQCPLSLHWSQVCGILFLFFHFLLLSLSFPHSVCHCLSLSFSFSSFLLLSLFWSLLLILLFLFLCFFSFFFHYDLHG